MVNSSCYSFHNKNQKILLNAFRKGLYQNHMVGWRKNFSLKNNSNIYFAGQISGVEGYVESAASGLLVAINILNRINGKESIDFGSETMLGSLANYVSTESKNFQPMNANFGILPELEEKIKDKKLKYQKLANRALTL